MHCVRALSAVILVKHPLLIGTPGIVQNYPVLPSVFTHNFWDISRLLAEDEGFEPSVGHPTHAFQACALGRYANPPVLLEG